jgi:ATP-dependent Clp protease protease subunit
MSKKFWKWSNAVESNDSELVIEGDISSQESWWFDTATPEELRNELKKHTGDLTVSLNSGGGDVFAGVAMYNALRNYDGKVTVRVDGLAASIASVIAMAGDKVVMSPGSMMMVHKPWTMVAGDANELEKVREVLNGIEDSLIPIYATRTGKTEEEVRELLEAETWMTGDEAVEMGFADEAIIEAKTAYSDAIKNLMSGKLAFSMSATQTSMEKLVDKIKSSADEEVKDVPTSKPTGESSKKVEKNAAEDEPKNKVETDKPKAVDKAEPTAEVKKSKSAKKESVMTDEEKLAASQVIEPKNQADPKAAPKPNLKAYLKTDEAMEAFAQILQANPGDMGDGSSNKVRNAWKEHLEVKAGVTNPEIFLPTPLITAIQNAFEDGGEIWSRVAKVGADVWNAAWDTEDDENSNDGRARGYNRSVAEDKAEQVLTFDDRIIRPQFVYKYITLNKEDIKEQRSTGALVTYVLSELPQRIVREVERAIVLGDGRASNNAYKIKEGDPRGFYPILADATAGNFFAGVVELDGTESKAEAVAKAKDALRTGGVPVLIAKKGYSTSARFEKDNDGHLLFPLGTKASDVFDIDTIIEPDWFNDTNSPLYDAVVVVLPAYKVVGDTTIEGFQNFILKTNKQEYLQEIWAGGGLSGRKAAIAIPTPTS